MFPTLASLGRTIIFVASRADCEDLATAIRNSSTSSSSAIVDTIHGDKDQRDRNSALLALKKGKVSALIATDVAARGLDVRDIRTVVNFDVAKNIDSHVHRVGRAGRMINTKKKKKEKENAPGDAVETTGDGTSGGGEYQKGDAYTLLTPKNADFANLLLESFEKEGREVSQELAALAMKSKRWGGGRSRRSKSGLGFHDEDHHHGGGGGGGGSGRSIFFIFGFCFCCSIFWTFFFFWFSCFFCVFCITFFGCRYFIRLLVFYFMFLLCRCGSCSWFFHSFNFFFWLASRHCCSNILGSNNSRSSRSFGWHRILLRKR
mmetsp:Transcript_2521/g.3370  ORF Transcript_2521/g.3370 Transcript_2521/m.3370 type:complete len:318 (+) Transcript_2521:545-1498(+)